MEQSFALRASVFTSWGTMLYIDVASGELRHGPIQNSPANAVFVADPASSELYRHGWLMHDTGDGLQPILCLREGSGVASNGVVVPTSFLLFPLENAQFGLKSDGICLCAEPNGSVTLSRTTHSDWESFRLSEFSQPAVRDPSEPTSSPAIDADIVSSTERTPVSLGRETEQSNVPETQSVTRFARRRVIVVRHRGNLANKMLQYMGAKTLAQKIEDVDIVNVSIPEWGIEIPDDTQDQVFFDNVDMWVWDPFRPHVEELCAIANRSESIRIMLADHLQRMEFLLDRSFYQDLFQRTSVLPYQPSSEDLVINIRTKEILRGVPHYPLLPITFYEDVVAKSGLRPVFVGQLSQSEYVRQLRARFPEAPFIESGDPRVDFALIRAATNIVVAVSTFSWLAAWLSNAKTIVLPLSGFLNPGHHREIDLLPLDDVRYRFFLFPLNFGVPEREAMDYHNRMNGRWKEVSRNQVALIKTSAPFLRSPRQNMDNGLPSRSAPAAQITFDSIWYAHEYLDAAMEISEGWFEDPLHHYLEVGRLRGYLPTRPLAGGPLVDLDLPNLALHKRATQSSRSAIWSKGSTPEEDARNAVDGKPWRDYAFHTEEEQNPWWMVDLGNIACIRHIRVFNRSHVEEHVHRRASPLVVEGSDDGTDWRLLFQTLPGQIFGGCSGGNPLLWSAVNLVRARFVRLTVPRRSVLHLAQVEVYGMGSAADDQSGAPARC